MLEHSSIQLIVKYLKCVRHRGYKAIKQIMVYSYKGMPVQLLQRIKNTYMTLTNLKKHEVKESCKRIYMHY